MRSDKKRLCRNALMVSRFLKGGNIRFEKAWIVEELSNLRLSRFYEISSREVHEARLSGVLLWRCNHELISKDRRDIRKRIRYFHIFPLEYSIAFLSCTLV